MNTNWIAEVVVILDNIIIVKENFTEENYKSDNIFINNKYISKIINIQY